MNSFIFAINAVLPLFLLVILGYVIKRIGLVTDEWLTIANRFSFKVTFSVLIFYNIYTSDTKVNDIDIKIILFAVVSVLAIVAICFIIVPFLVKDHFKTGVVIQGIFRSNYLLFGIPLVFNMFGESAKAITSILMAVIIPLFNVLAVITLSIYNKNNNKKINFNKLVISLITNPLIIGCIVGFAFKLFINTLPKGILDTASSISDLAVPFALIILGGQFKFSGFLKNLSLVIKTVAVKLILVPVVLLSLAVLLGFRDVELACLISLFCSPTAVSSSIMAYSMDCDGDLAGQIVVFGTLFSIVTIFLAIFILKSLSFI